MNTKEEILKLAGEPAVSLFQDCNGKWQPFIDAQHERNTRDSMAWHVADFYTADQVIAAILKVTKPLEEEVERLKTVPMKYRRMAFNGQLQDENKELRAQLAAVQEECEFQRNAHKQAEELMLEQGNQLTAAQEENGRLRIALDCTKTDLVRMRCPDFFEGVKGGYETLFDGHLVNMIGLINDHAK